MGSVTWIISARAENSSPERRADAFVSYTRNSIRLKVKSMFPAYMVQAYKPPNSLNKFCMKK